MLQPAYDDYLALHREQVARIRRNCRIQKCLGGLILAAMLLGVAWACSGCSVLHQIAPNAFADTPAKRWAQAREGLTSTSELFVIAARSGRLDDRQVVEYGTLLQEARALIGAEPPAGGALDDTLEGRLREAEDLLTKLKTTLQEHKP